MNSTDLSQASADDLKKSAEDALQKAGGHLAERASQLGDFAASARYDTEDFIQTHPWPAIALAAGAGFVAGLLLGRR